MKYRLCAHAGSDLPGQGSVQRCAVTANPVLPGVGTVSAWLLVSTHCYWHFAASLCLQVGFVCICTLKKKKKRHGSTTNSLYMNSGGEMNISGGEALLQDQVAQFCFTLVSLRTRCLGVVPAQEEPGCKLWQCMATGSAFCPLSWPRRTLKVD